MVPAKLLFALQEQYNRIGKMSNPRTPTRNNFLLVALCLGVENLQKIPARKALALLAARVDEGFDPDEVTEEAA
jgi:hypothetical protein